MAWERRGYDTDAGHARSWRRWALVAIVLVAVVWGLAVASGLAAAGGREDASRGAAAGATEEASRAAAAEETTVPLAADTLHPGESLTTLLVARGLGPQEAAHLAGLVRERAGAEGPDLPAPVSVAPDPRGRPRVRIRLDADRWLAFHLEGARWHDALEEVTVRRDTAVVGGRVARQLYAVELFGDAEALAPRGHAEVLRQLEEAFGSRLDPWRDPRPGDVYRAAVERQVRPDGSLRALQVLAATYEGAATGSLVAVRYGPGDGPAAYRDAEGRPLRGAYLRAPVAYARVTSGFTGRRFHPVLRRALPHRGVDYGAPAGTPVRATADGRVASAGWRPGQGLTIEIRHAAGVRTLYAHLSRVEPGIAAGAAVVQGETIGRVGSTGLATGPHLHYEVLRHGRAVDPRGLGVPSADPVSAREWPRFLAVRDAALALLDRPRSDPSADGLPVRPDEGAGPGAAR